MAEAIKQTTVTLTMTEEEARHVRAILGKVQSGDADKTTYSAYDALASVVPRDPNDPIWAPENGIIRLG